MPGMTTPTIAQNSFVTLHYRISLPAGEAELVSTFGDRPATLQLGCGQLAPGLEAKLLGLGEGTRATFDIAPAEGYGERNPELIQRVSRKLLEKEGEPGAQYEPGDLVDFPGPDGGRYAGVLKELDETGALFDFNHPLAGQALRFEVQIIGVM
jgi:FKBP-type peptidyl-prolyl cis-trans isomerase SlpA